MKIVSGLIAIFVALPIWFYLHYKILEAVNASELMWFLYWIYIPSTLAVSIIAKLVEEK